MITVVFAMIYKIVPRVRIDWKDVWIGAATTSLLFTVGKFLIGVYIGRSGIASGFGAAASLVVVLVWVYYSAQIFLLGAEFTRAYAHKFGSRRNLPPEDAPVAVSPAAPSPNVNKGVVAMTRGTRNSLRLDAFLPRSRAMSVIGGFLQTA